MDNLGKITRYQQDLEARDPIPAQRAPSVRCDTTHSKLANSELPLGPLFDDCVCRSCRRARRLGRKARHSDGGLEIALIAVGAVIVVLIVRFWL